MAKDSRLHDRLVELTGPEIEALGLDLVELELLSGGNRLTLRYSLERKVDPGAAAEERRAGINDIARASRTVARAIEAQEAEDGDFMPGRYTIEATSPGIFRKLSRPEHFVRFCGHRVRLLTGTADQSLERHGELLSADDRQVEIADEKEGTLTVPYDRILKANLDPVLDFNRRGS